MKKAAPKAAEAAPKLAPEGEENKDEEVAVPEFGFGKFEYVNQASYVGNWRLVNGKKCKHGHGKMTTPGITSG